MVFLSVLFWGAGLSWALASAEVVHIGDTKAFSAARDAKSIFIDTQTSTWKTRGVMFWDVEGSLLVKLRDAGFQIVRKKTEPHALTLSATYAETRGQNFAINRFGTVIEGVFRVAHHTEGPLFEIRILETSNPTVTGTPPYLDVLHNFMTNPYYHYLGELVRGEIKGSQDPQEILLQALQEELQPSPPTDDADPVMAHSQRPQHSMPIDKSQYSPVAVRRTIDELVIEKDVRLVGILKDMVQHPDVNVQVRSVEAFGDFQVTEALPFLETLSQETERVEVRSAARDTINVLRSLPQ